jgi:glyoxylase-like metal-dependent hydrolase (beta-lactamase superfamily II)/8-oxo-dGTP pyrophosphatase MutT (NUDIX family)
MSQEKTDAVRHGVPNGVPNELPTGLPNAVAGARPNVVRYAGSLIVLRDTAAGPEVLMMQRPERGDDLRSGAAVFPGGGVDARDHDSQRWCLGLADPEASARLGLPAGGLDYWVAAVRETFEEVGVLLACDGAGEPVDTARHAEALALWRGRLQRGEAAIGELCDALGLRLDLRFVAYFSHWLTPPGQPKRFDTRFFVTRMPAGQQAAADGAEAQHLMWLTPAAALDPAAGLKLLPVTRRTLQTLAGFRDSADALAQAEGWREIPLIMPRIASSRKGRRAVLPDEPPYAEIARLDPDGRGDVSADIVPGAVVRLSPRVIRITAPNAGMMTGPGTNSYLVGDPDHNEWTAIDPGPADGGHVQALHAAAPGPIVRILVTHTHVDHSPGAALLARLTGAPVFGRRPLHGAGQDASFEPVRELAPGERLLLGSQATLRVLHTPGHASNHLCYLLEEETLLFTGDHVMQGSTVVINPPDGDMGAYLRALQALLDEALDWLAPGHGFLVARPHEVIRALIAHRLKREARVVDALDACDAHGAATIDKLLPMVYADVPPALHPVARRSLLAHLLKLEADGVALADGEGWRRSRD